jgi:aspartyl-tRNA(Asn)/glutamyl-tRNA(Gln) amidotransferase subunit A
MIPRDAMAHSPTDLFDLTGLFAAGSFTPIQAADLYLARIERHNPTLGAFLTLDADGARQAARASAARWSAGRPLSELDGAPFGVKANIAVGGLPWHGGIGAYRDRIAVEDADCVAALRRAGAVVLGIVNMHEAALGATTDNPVFGRCQNPYRHGFTPGGSSGGSAAAVAAGLCAAALGTDTLGSVRIPASYCGVIGHMVPRGRLALDGVMPLAWTLDSLGVITRSARDARVILSVLAGAFAGLADRGARPNDMVCGVLDFAGRSDVNAEVEAAFDRMLSAAASAGMTLRPVKLDFYDVVSVRRLCLLITEVEALVIHQARLESDPEGFSAELTGMLRWAAQQGAVKLAAAYRQLALTAQRIVTALEGLDALLTPTTGRPAFAFDQPPAAGQADFTVLANIAGLAATAFPIGFSQGLPLSAQVISACDATALTVAERLAVPFNPPPLFPA